MLAVVFTAVLGSFFATTLITVVTSQAVSSLSDSIVHNSSPSIQRLASLRASTVEVELALSHYLHEGGSPTLLATRVDSSLDKVREGVQGYLSLPVFPGEERWHDQLEQSWARFNESVRRTRNEAEANKYAEARQTSAEIVNPAATLLVDAALRAIEFNADNGRALASRIKETRRRAIWLMSALTASCAVLGVAGAILIHRQARTRRTLVEAHAKFLEARAAELEQFAGRVAHDIRNPLSTAGMAAELVLRRTADEGTRDYMNRIIHCLWRANSITSGLLDFARSGAQPDPGARASVPEVIGELASGIAPDAEHARIEMKFEPAPPVFVACSTGVYLSLLSNLVRNAIKYMGDVTTRCITVRVTHNGDIVRTAVADTGPGIPPENLPSLFEPYFRGHRGENGLGLGLATVKKLAEGHKGRVGVWSERGQGSLFWFELPQADAPIQTPAKSDRLSSETQPGIHS
jgi:signal transduction histidine kinase